MLPQALALGLVARRQVEQGAGVAHHVAVIRSVITHDPLAADVGLQGVQVRFGEVVFARFV